MENTWKRKLYFHYLFGHDSSVSELFIFNIALHVYFVHNFPPFLIVLINNFLQQGSVTTAKLLLKCLSPLRQLEIELNACHVS